MDNDYGVLEMTVEHFSSRGFKVVKADNIEGGWHTAYKERFDSHKNGTESESRSYGKSRYTD